jgi:hypothetical protein
VSRPPGREVVKVAMIPMADRTDAQQTVLWNDGRTSESILRGNASVVARELYAEASYLRMGQAPDAVAARIEALADKLDPQT